MENHTGRYVIGLEKVEKIPENGGHSVTIRLTFYLEIPDAKNPENEKWKVRFCCNLHENPEAIDLRQSGIEEINDEVNSAIRDAVTKILHAMQRDLNSIVVGYDYIFYPEMSVELIKVSFRSDQSEMTQRKRFIAGPRFRTASVGTATSVERAGETQLEQVSFITLKAPFHVHPILGQINHVLSKPGEAAPFLVLPGNVDRPIIELPQSISDAVLQNIDNIVGTLQNTNYTQPQEIHYYSLPSKSVCTSTPEVSGLVYHSSAPNTVNRQSGSNLIGNKSQAYSSGTDSTGSLSLTSRDFTTIDGSSDPIQSTPLTHIKGNLQDTQKGFVQHRDIEAAFNEHGRMPPIQSNSIPFSSFPLSPTLRRGSANLPRSFSPSSQSQLENMQHFQFSSMKPPIYARSKTMSPSRHNCVTFSDQIQTHPIPQIHNTMFESAKLSKSTNISSGYQPRQPRAASIHFDFNNKEINPAMNFETPLIHYPMAPDPTQSVIVKPDIAMMASPSLQMIQSPTSYFVLTSPQQTPKKCISCPSILSDVQVSPIQYQPPYSASHIGPVTSNFVKVGFQGTSGEFEQKLLQSSAINRLAVVAPAPTSVNKKVPTKFTKPELVRLCTVFSHVPNLHWIVIEDSINKTDLVTDVLNYCTVTSTHLNIPSPKDKNYHIKGSNQRNAGLQWLRETLKPGKIRGVVYFADDDNTYDPRLFEEMRTLQLGATWPVGIVGGSSWEGCICAPDNPNRITGFWTGYKPWRSFPIDMAAFAINLDLLFVHPNASFDYIHVEQQEGTILSQLGFKTAHELEPRANGCSKILVWHTKTSVPAIPRQRRFQPHINDYF
nr:galactosylgalactosylxylosylprotein [Hymenolepis microstoma]